MTAAGVDVEQGLPGIIEAKTRTPPERGGPVDRTSLLDDLSITDASVVLAQAPAGFGKSTVLEQWAHRGERKFAWVSLDPSESDPILFWRHVYAALQVCVHDFASHLHDEIAKPGLDLSGSIVPGILNELATIESKLVIVLDDYHQVESPEVDRTVELLIRHLPRGTALAIGTRTQPRLAIARLRSRGLVHDLDASTLSLTLDETGRVLRSQNPGRTDDEVAWIHKATEGWPAGVYLFGLLDTLDMSTRTTSDIRDYLMTEMLSSLVEDDLRFMRDTSILSHLEGEVCDYVTQGHSSQRRLARLAGSNLLIMPVDQPGNRFRYHHLLQAELLARLRQDESQEAVASLHRRAMEWTERQRDISAAIQHAVRADDIEKATDLVAEHWYGYIMSGRAHTAFQWLREFDDQELRTLPRLTIAAAMISAFTGATAEAREFAANAETAEHSGEGLSGTTSYESSVAVMRAAIAADGPISALADAHRAAEAEPLDSSWRPALAAMIGAYTCFTTPGDREAQRLLLEGADAATGPPEIAAYALGTLALVHAWRNDTEAALHYARRAIERIDETNVGGLLLYGLPYAVAARFSVDDDTQTESERLLRYAALAERAATNSTPLDSMVLRTAMAEACLEMGDHDRARVYAQRALGNLAVMTEGGLVAARLNTVIRRINASSRDAAGEAVSASSLLSPRELQVVALLETGDTLEDIGRRLYVSRNTVKTYTARIYRKLDVSDRYQAVNAARRLGISR